MSAHPDGAGYVGGHDGAGGAARWGGSVLIVEDERAVANYYRGLLQTDGLSATCTHSGRDALARARQDAYSALLLDVRLPDISGIDVLRELRAEGDATPAVVITAYYDAVVEMAATALQAEVRRKPFVGRKLVELVESQIALGSPRQSAPTRLDSLERTIDLLTRSGAAAAGAGHRERLMSLLTVLLDSATEVPVFIRAALILKAGLANSAFDTSAAAAAALMLSDAQGWRRRAPKELIAATANLERAIGMSRAVHESAVARAVGVGRDRLSALFRTTGIDFRTWRRVLLVQRALPGVLLSDDQIAQAAYTAGYHHPSKLNEHVGALFGLAPGELRRRYRDLSGPTYR